MTELSPAAQAVLNALIDNWQTDPYEMDVKAVAAALRVAVDQVVPEHANAVGDEHDEARHDQWLRIRYKFLAIVAELESK